MPRKRAAKITTSTTSTAAARPAVRFWVPPSLEVEHGGTSRSSSKPLKSSKQLKGWVPSSSAAGVAMTSGELTVWERDVEGLSHSCETIERVNGVDVRCIWYGSPTLSGLVAIGYPGHARRLMAFVKGVATDRQPSSGYCQDHDRSTADALHSWDSWDVPACEGARWVLAYLESRVRSHAVIDSLCQEEYDRATREKSKVPVSRARVLAGKSRGN